MDPVNFYSKPLVPLHSLPVELSKALIKGVVWVWHDEQAANKNRTSVSEYIHVQR